MTLRHLFIVLILSGSLFLVACSKEQTSTPQNSAKEPNPVESTVVSSTTFSAELLPTSANSATDLQVILHGGASQPSYRWKVNGVTIADTHNARLNSNYFTFEDNVNVVITSPEGMIELQTLIGNAPPQIVSVDLATNYIYRGVDIRATPKAIDPEKDLINFSYTWFIDGDKLDNPTENILPGDRFQRGDSVRLEVVAHDFSGPGETFHAADLVIPNAFPRINSSPPMAFKAEVYSYQVVAEDNDGDVLAYSLSSGPQGMTIDRQSGLLNWQVDASLIGPQRVEIVVTDPLGDQDVQTFDLTLH
ncbi:MAG: hypothetical protein L3J63_01155 [Geopsychrobacter sp.]|nr:hypothetical protein [Geopsychrobacter sp.]